MGVVGTNLDWGIDQLVIVFCYPATALLRSIGCFRQGYKGFPAFWYLELKPVGLPAFPLDLNGNGRQGQKAMVCIEMAGPHTEFGGYQLVVNLQGLKVLKPNLPARGTGAS